MAGPAPAPVLVVTGASSGIGRAVAGLFLARGWAVAALARRAGPLEDLAAGQPLALPLWCDVRDPAAVEEAFAATEARFGRIDVLFNNAGIFPPAATIDEMPLDHWHDCLAVDLTGMCLCARAAIARMRRQNPQGGRIINNVSVSARAPRPGALGYTVTKHGVTGMTRQLALDGRPFGIACGQIDIGNVRSPLADHLGQGARQADGSIRPEPMIELDEVAEAVWLMATLPARANVLDLTIMATTMPLVGRG
jgi:NAD(P)-dependent dehydrogenase (short-subunit alcohol dehydrogenase family)